MAKEPTKKATNSHSLRCQWLGRCLREVFIALRPLLTRHLTENRSFAFSSNLGEVTETLRALPVETAIERVNLKYGGATDYARAFEDFADLAMADINRVTTVIVLGDARNNNTDPRLDLLAEIRSKCRQLIWLNPESQSSWS